MTTAPGRRSSTFTRLLRHGFTDASAAERLLDGPALAPVGADPALLDALGATADPDLALRGLARLAEAQPDGPAELLSALVSAKPLRDRLLGVLGASEALGDHLARHPLDWRTLAAREAADPHPGVAGFERDLAAATDPVSLRVAYRRSLLAIAARDVCGAADVPGPPPSWPTSPRRRSARRSPSRRPPPPTTPPGAGSRSSRWASAAAANSTTSPTWT